MVEAISDEAVAGTEYDGHVGRTTIGATLEQFHVWDMLVHRRDIARAAGADAGLTDAELDQIESGAEGFGAALHMEGICRPELAAPADADRTTRVLARLGRTARPTACGRRPVDLARQRFPRGGGSAPTLRHGQHRQGSAPHRGPAPARAGSGAQLAGAPGAQPGTGTLEVAAVEAYSGFEPQVGQIRALRTFRIGPDGRLYPLFSQQPWLDGPNAARCLRADVDPHPAPEPACRCGFYAYGSAPAVDQPHARHVLAVVECWGRVIAGTRGVRVEQSRIVALWLSRVVPADLVAQIGRNYPSVALHRDRQRMTAEYPPTELDCYESLAPGSAGVGWPWWLVAVAVAGLGSLPRDWLGGPPVAGLLLIVTAAVFGVAALCLRWRRSLGSPDRSLLFLAVALWLLAAFLGPTGLVFVRLPLLQAAVAAGLLRTLTAREARRIPARIG